jgi:hydrogenase maturation protease
LLFGSETGVVNIVGIGNPIKGDDGVGLEIVSTLRRELGPSPVPGLRIQPLSLYPELLISRIARSGERILIVDAVEANKEPGAIVCSRLRDAKFGFFATHNLPLKILPEVAENLDESYVLGVQPESVEVGEGLSEKVRATSDRLVAAITAMIKGRE